MKTLFKTLIILLVLLTAASCTQYRFFPFPLPEEDDSTPYDVSSAEDFSRMLSTTGQARLTGNVTIDTLDLSASSMTSYAIDLNEHDLMISDNSSIVFPDGEKTITISNGNLTTNEIEGHPYSETYKTAASIVLGQNNSLILDNVHYTANSTGIALGTESFSSTGASLTLRNSTIEADGAYAIATNATLSDGGDNLTEDVTIELYNSTLIANGYHGDSSAILLNIPGTLIIGGDCTITGDRQAVIVRNGNATINNSTLTSTGEYSDGADPEVWKDGSEVPFATLVVGNKGSSAYDSVSTSCTVTNTSITMQNNTGMDVYVASDNGNTVTFTSSQYAQDVADKNHYYKGANSILNLFAEDGTPIDLDN